MISHFLVPIIAAVIVLLSGCAKPKGHGLSSEVTPTTVHETTVHETEIAPALPGEKDLLESLKAQLRMTDLQLQDLVEQQILLDSERKQAAIELAHAQAKIREMEADQQARIRAMEADQQSQIRVLEAKVKAEEGRANSAEIARQELEAKDRSVRRSIIYGLGIIGGLAFLAGIALLIWSASITKKMASGIAGGGMALVLLMLYVDDDWVTVFVRAGIGLAVACTAAAAIKQFLFNQTSNQVATNEYRLAALAKSEEERLARIAKASAMEHMGTRSFKPTVFTLPKLLTGAAAA